MTNNSDLFIQLIKDHKLKVTPQRLAILQIVYSMEHPSAEDVYKAVKINQPNISLATVYKVLDTFVDLGIINKVKTDSDQFRYDSKKSMHHHLYCKDCNTIEDYEDENLNELLRNYFANISIPNFKVENVVLEIHGTFNHK